MHHLGQRCMLSIVSALQIQIMKWFFWSKTPKRSWFFGAERPIIFSWGRVLFFWESDQVNFCAIPAGIVNPRVECKEWGSRPFQKDLVWWYACIFAFVVWHKLSAADVTRAWTKFLGSAYSIATVRNILRLERCSQPSSSCGNFERPMLILQIVCNLLVFRSYRQPHVTTSVRA